MDRRAGYDKWKKFFEENWLIAAIVVFAAFTRFAALSRVPAGVLPDEAYGAYNAWGLMTEGLDSRGYHFPVYFVAWGSGMNALYSYLAIPMFFLFGTNILAYRLPQAIVGILTVWAMYRLGRELFDRRMALLLAFAVAVNPWHVMNTRFGLESNLAPGMFVIGLMFLVSGIKRKSGHLIGAAVFLGAALYCYALTWIMIPLFLLLGAALFWKKISKSKVTVLFLLLLFLIALPLLLFVCINLGWMEEIRTPLFSIPKLVAFRGEELDIAHFGESFRELARMVLSQYSEQSHVTSELVGTYYLFTTPFMAVGVLFHLISLCKNYKNGDNDLQYVFLLWLFSAGFMCLLNENITIIHTNMIHIPIIFYGVYGIVRVADYLKNRWIIPAVLVFWCVSFGLFAQDYVSSQPNTRYFVDGRADEAIERAKELAGEDGIVTIFDFTSIKYSYLLWYEKPPVSDYCQNVVYEEDDAWAEMLSYGKYRYVRNPEGVTAEGVYIVSCNWAEYFMDLGFEVEKVNDLYYVAVG